MGRGDAVAAQLGAGVWGRRVPAKRAAVPPSRSPQTAKHLTSEKQKKTAQQSLHSLPVHESQGISQFLPKP